MTRERPQRLPEPTGWAGALFYARPAVNRTHGPDRPEHTQVPAIANPTGSCLGSGAPDSATHPAPGFLAPCREERRNQGP